MSYDKARIILLIDSKEIFFRFRVGGGGTREKSSKMTSVDWSFSEYFLNISRTNSKTSKINQQSVLNL